MARSPARPGRYKEVRALLELAVLGFLAEQSMHAYELRKRLTALMGHMRPISDGALYPALNRLRQQDLIARRSEPGSGGPARHIFDLTTAGRDDLRRRLAELDDLDITDRNKYFVVLAFLHLLPSPELQAEVLRRRLDFLRDLQRGFFVKDGRVLRTEELSSPFRAGIQQIARVTSAAEQKWLAATLDDLEAGGSAT